MYDQNQKTQILKVAREAVRSALENNRPNIPKELDPALHEPRGCFVTLQSLDKKLRGCIGTFSANNSLVDTIIEMGGAATKDSRFSFDPVTTRELDRLLIEVSVLTPMEKIDDPLLMRIGTDGIYIIEPTRQVSGCFLPQVAPEQGWDAVETLSYCCSHKMGLAHDAWQKPTALEFYRFQAIVMSESAPGRVGRGNEQSE